MNDSKTERLINLLLALLSTRRYLTKEEIFSSVDGYEGNPESRERMFERDKEELRSLGIVIEVGSNDLFFEDEIGYKIPFDNYEIQFDDLTSDDLSILGIAASLWRDQAFGESSKAALRRMHSLGIETDFEQLEFINARSDAGFYLVEEINRAIEEKRKISFSYRSEKSNRVVAPYATVFYKGFWYLIGFDEDQRGLRIFKLNRVEGKVKTKGKLGSYEIPEGFSAAKYLSENWRDQSFAAIIAIRPDRALDLRHRSEFLESKDGWDIHSKTYDSEESLIKELLMFGDSVLLLQPVTIREKIHSRLEEILHA
jgi:proteasome accessory factor B